MSSESELGPCSSHNEIIQADVYNVGGKGKDDEEIEMNIKKRFEFDGRKRAHYVVTLTAVILYFS